MHVFFNELFISLIIVTCFRPLTMYLPSPQLRNIIWSLLQKKLRIMDMLSSNCLKVTGCFISIGTFFWIILCLIVFSVKMVPSAFTVIWNLHCWSEWLYYIVKAGLIFIDCDIFCLKLGCLTDILTTLDNYRYIDILGTMQKSPSRYLCYVAFKQWMLSWNISHMGTAQSLNLSYTTSEG